MAFHLHRLKLIGRPLHAAGYHQADAADLAAARSILAPDDIAILAGRLATAPLELTRSLNDDEQRAWTFYRAAAANPRHVWEAARSAWTSRGLTDKDAANIMGFKPKTVSDAKVRPFVLTFTAALHLTTALNITGGPEVLLPRPADNNPQQTR